MDKSSVYLFLDSKHSLSPATPDRCSFLLNFDTEKSNTKRIMLEQCSFPHLYYPVNSNNNTLVIRENDAINTTFTIPVGQYSGSTLASTLKSILDAGTQTASVYTVSYSSINNKLTIASTVPYQILSTSTALEVIGYDAMASSSTSQEGDRQIRVDGTAYVDIISNLPVRNFSTTGYGNTLARVYLTENYGNVIYFKVGNQVGMPFHSNEITTLDIQLRDEFGNRYVLPANAHVSYTLRLDY